MTEEEAIEILEDRAWWDMVSILLPRDGAASAALHSAVDIGISALRAQQTKLDRIRWEGCINCTMPRSKQARKNLGYRHKPEED